MVEVAWREEGGTGDNGREDGEGQREHRNKNKPLFRGAERPPELQQGEGDERTREEENDERRQRRGERGRREIKGNNERSNEEVSV